MVAGSKLVPVSNGIHARARARFPSRLFTCAKSSPLFSRHSLLATSLLCRGSPKGFAFWGDYPRQSIE